MYNQIHVLLLKLSYIFRRLPRHPQEEIYRNFKTTAAAFDYSS